MGDLDAISQGRQIGNPRSFSPRKLWPLTMSWICLPHQLLGYSSWNIEPASIFWVTSHWFTHLSPCQMKSPCTYPASCFPRFSVHHINTVPTLLAVGASCLFLGRCCSAYGFQEKAVHTRQKSLLHELINDWQNDVIMTLKIHFLIYKFCQNRWPMEEFHGGTGSKFGLKY